MTAAKRTKAAPKRKPSTTKRTSAKKPAKTRSRGKSRKHDLAATMKALPQHVVDYIKEHPKVALSAVAGVGLAVATSALGPLRMLKLAANPALVAAVKELAEKALATAKAA